MLRTVNDKYPWLVSLLAVVYIAWVATSSYLAQVTHLGWSYYNQKVATLSHQSDVTALIFGGSNAAFSLSAAEMSTLSGEKWFNGSLMNEGFSFENQTSFVNDVARSLDPEAVETVVISSIRHIQGGRTENLFATHIAQDGDKTPPLWLPYSSLASLVLDPPGKPFPEFVNDSGDLIHDAADECRPGRGAHPIEWADDARIDDILDTWLPLVGRSFPNASIVMTIPSQFVLSPIPPDEIAGYTARLQDRIDAWASRNAGVIVRPVSVIVEPNIEDRSLVCNTSHHLNEAGRSVRTESLYQLLHEQGVIDGR